MINMFSQPSTSDAVDPLDGVSILSLFPRTLKKLPTDPKAVDSVGDGDDNSTCLHLKAVVLKSPAKFLKEAKTILNDSSETVRAFNESIMDVERRTEAADVVTKERPRERRPGLGLKRAKFSFKPKSSQPSANLECEIDIEKYPDPESFFDAVRRMERAKKEIEKLRGGALMELDQNIPSRAERRQRRPGLYGDREPVSYKHRYQIEAFDIDKTILLSQETPGQGTRSQSCNFMLPETNDHDISSERRRRSGNVSAAGKNEDDLFDKLMSDNCVVDEDGAVNMLDGDRAENTLQELLQIKPLDLDDNYLPEMHDIRRIEPKTLSEALPNRRVRKSVLHEMMTTVPVDTSCGSSQVAGKSIHPHLSPTLPKSPLASISSLQRRITQTLVTNDPFTFVDASSSPLGISSLKEHARKESDPIDKEVPTAYGELDSQVRYKDSADQIACGELNEPALRDSLSSKEIISDNATLSGVCLDIRFVESDCLNDDVGDRVMDNNLGDHHNDVVCVATGPKDLGNEVSEVVQSFPGQPDLPGPVMEISAVEESSVKVDPPLGVHQECLGLATEETLETCDVRKGERGNATSCVVDSNMTLKRNSKAVPDRSHRKKELCRRQSLAGAGTKWDCGLRRSTRIRMRPLEYWRGERMLYGRVHESLITAIGVKYMSPSKDGPQMKVKSYVSDEYKDLVDQVALH